MPCLEIKIPKMDDSTRSLLTKELTSAFVEVFGFPADIFGIHFDEYEYGETASGGKICDGRENRPYIHFVLFCSRTKRSVKQKIVDRFTTVYIECVNNPDWKPVIHICEYPYDNIGVGGELLSDSYEEYAKRKFYYDLPKE